MGSIPTMVYIAGIPMVYIAGIPTLVYIPYYTTLGTPTILHHSAPPGTPTPVFSDSAGRALGSVLRIV